MSDVHKACDLLIEYGLLSMETTMLANKHCYHESYMKRIPRDKSNSLDFSLKLAKFGIVNIDKYYESLKTSKFVIFKVDEGLHMMNERERSFLLSISSLDPRRRLSL